MAGWFSSLSRQSGLWYEELFLHQLGPCAVYREICAVEGACQADSAGVNHDALLSSMFLLLRQSKTQGGLGIGSRVVFWGLFV